MVRTVISTKFKEDFAKAGLNSLADGAANMLTTGERDWSQGVSQDSKVMGRDTDPNPHPCCP